MSDLHAGMGLRERKRLAAMRRVQTVALDLFERDSFDRVTIEQIAEQSEVSPSSVYRYFGTKEMLVIWDEYDPAALAALAAEMAQRPPLEAIRLVVRTMMQQLVSDDEERVRRRLRLAYSNPSIEAASALQSYEMSGLIAQVLTQQLDDVDDLDVQVFAYAFVGALLGALRHWYDSDFTTPFDAIVERPLAVVEGGLPLG